MFNEMISDNLNIDYNRGNDENFIISADKYPHIYEHLEQLCVSSITHLPQYVFELSQRQSNILLEALLQGEATYAATSLQLANDVSTLVFHCGLSATIKPHTSKDMLMYKINIVRRQNAPWVNKTIEDGSVSKEEKLVHYTGKVYCVEMPSSHTYYMRETAYSPTLIIGNSSRHGQKGTCGNIIPEEDMPFTKSGLRPDIIINPHAIPSRMTIGQLKEMLLGKVLVELGLFGDGTSFGDLDVSTISKKLSELGFESHCNEIMYDGLTGEQMESDIFMGPVFYQRLKHMVSDKQHSRSIGPMVNLTRQPAEGRSRDGGLRFGEMERDCMVSHGASRFTRGRMYDASDKFQVHICKKCGMIAAHNDEMHIHHCRTCDNKTEFSYVEIPYAYKLLSQELITMNVAMRVITDH